MSKKLFLQKTSNFLGLGGRALLLGGIFWIFSCAFLYAQKEALVLFEETQVFSSWGGKKAKGLVYGNDILQVLEEKNGWLRVSWGKKGQKGWVPQGAVGWLENLEELGEKKAELEKALQLRDLGKREQAESILFSLSKGNPRAWATYEATRLLLLYYSLEKLRKSTQGKVTREALEKAKEGQKKLQNLPRAYKFKEKKISP